MSSFDIILLGGGLHSSLAALALASERPRLRVAVVEMGVRIGGNHLWSFHAGDMPEPAPTWLARLIAFHWPRYEVRFPNHRRIIHAPYRTMTSDKLHDAVSACLGRCGNHRLFLERRVVSCTAHHVVLDDGMDLEASVVLDGRGLHVSQSIEGSGYQKFCGTELILRRAHRFAHPVLMDATIEQIDGFHFMYLLPFSDHRLFIEDTYFSDDSNLDCELVRQRVLAYADHIGLEVERLGREECGVLAMPWKKQPIDTDGLLSLGVRGGWYHPATAYSVPCALRTALAIARADSPARLRAELGRLRRRHEKQARFARLLNQMVFRCFSPGQRIHVFEHFYRLPEATIRRFYSLDMTIADRLRILSGHPPRGFSLVHAWQRREARA